RNNHCIQTILYRSKCMGCGTCNGCIIVGAIYPLICSVIRACILSLPCNIGLINCNGSCYHYHICYGLYFTKVGFDSYSSSCFIRRNSDCDLCIIIYNKLCRNTINFYYRSCRKVITCNNNCTGTVGTYNSRGECYNFRPRKDYNTWCSVAAPTIYGTW